MYSASHTRNRCASIGFSYKATEKLTLIEVLLIPILYRIWGSNGHADVFAYVLLAVTACRLATEWQTTQANISYVRELLTLFGSLTPEFEAPRSLTKKAHLLQHLPDAMARMGPCLEMSAFGLEVVNCPRPE